MKKFKITGDKVLLALGAIGIVAAVAVIVFLISFNFGGKPDKKEQDTTSSQQSISDGAIGGASDEEKEETEAVTEGIAEVTDVQIDMSCRDAVKLFTDCFIFGKTDGAEKLLPASVWEAAASKSGCTTQELISAIKTTLASGNASSQMSEGGSVTCDVNSVLAVEDSTASEIKNTLSAKHGISAASVTDVYAVSMVLEYTQGGKKTAETDELFCVKIDGVWYLSERDCLAVYYMLGF